MLIAKQVIEPSLEPFLPRDVSVPPALVRALLRRFASQQGYAVFDDVRALFQRIPLHQRGSAISGDSAPWPWTHTVLGVVSNSDARVVDVLADCGLLAAERRFGHPPPPPRPPPSAEQHPPLAKVAFQALSYDVGAEKPARAIFDAAAQLAQAHLAALPRAPQPPPQLQLDEAFERLHVGDELLGDCFAAQAAGWHGVLVDRDNRFGTGDAAGVVQRVDSDGRSFKAVRSLEELAAWRPEDG